MTHPCHLLSLLEKTNILLIATARILNLLAATIALHISYTKKQISWQLEVENNNLII